MADTSISKDQGKGTESERIAELSAQRDELLQAAIAAKEWLDRFGEHAPIVFGGEPQLDEVLRKAIARVEQAEETPPWGNPDRWLPPNGESI